MNKDMILKSPQQILIDSTRAIVSLLIGGIEDMQNLIPHLFIYIVELFANNTSSFKTLRPQVADQTFSCGILKIYAA